MIVANGIERPPDIFSPVKTCGFARLTGPELWLSHFQNPFQDNREQ